MATNFVHVNAALRRNLWGTNARYFSNISKQIDISKMQKVQTANPRPKPALDNTLAFGKHFTDHMLEIEWSAQKGFGAPKISPRHKLELDPAVPALHYGVQCFEGMKAYKDKDGKIRLFRPELNMKRFRDSCTRLALPDFDGQSMLECIKEYIRTEQDWIPSLDKFALYLRPTCIAISESLGVQPPTQALFFTIACPVGPYFSKGFAPIRVLAESTYCRAWYGGTGCNKVGGNYALGLMPQQRAAAEGYSQVLWLAGADEVVTEVGAMNIFFVWKAPDGATELVTAPLDGMILPGVTRDSVLELCRAWGEVRVSERRFTMAEVAAAAREGRLLECFGSGTAAVVAPVDGIGYRGELLPIPCGADGRAGPLCARLHAAMADVHYGRAPFRDWSHVV